MTKYVLGIDTSCYTTSIAVVDLSANLILDKRSPLMVGKGQRGLRQSEAVFQHVKNLPVLFTEVASKFNLMHVTGITVTTCPRPMVDSYMPVFVSGQSYASVIASVLNIPIKDSSHQEGHMMAGLWSADVLQWKHSPFICCHLSGGTSELLLCHPDENGFSLTVIGGSKDLHAGQLIDRLGVSMGLSFPCGQQMERLANKIETKALPISVNHSWFNLSGVENYYKHQIAIGSSYDRVAEGILGTIAVSLEKCLLASVLSTGIKNILMVGGVNANSYIRQYLESKLENKANIRFAKPEYATDNAVGTALLF